MMHIKRRETSYPLYTRPPLIFSTVASSVKYLTISRANGIAVPIPLLVIIFPSTTTSSSEQIAPDNFSSNPGWQVAFLPSNNPASPSTLGAAQIARGYPSAFSVCQTKPCKSWNGFWCYS